MEIWGVGIYQFIITITLIALEYIGIIAGLYYYLFYKPHKLNLVNNPKIKRENYDKVHKYKIARATDKVPEYATRLTCLILRENKWCKILYFSGERTSFTFENCLYFLVTPHTCDNGAKVLIYLEGISLPVSYDNVEKELVQRKYIDLDGKERTSLISVIKGLKWDGKILHLFTNRKFAEIFTRMTPDISPFIIIIVGIATLVMTCVSVFVSYWYGVV